MFVRHAEPVSLTQTGLEGFCVSLNRPVVDIDPLPTGPARAAIALHRSESEERCLFVAVRSIESGAVAFFAFGAAIGSRHKAMNEGHSFAERMGFLFDEDMLQSRPGAPPADAADGAGGPSVARRALECWCELVGEEPPEDSASSVVSDSGEEILEVDDIGSLDLLDGGGMGLDEAVSAGDDEMLDDMVDLFDPELEKKVPLSKFRPGQEEPDPLGESTTLGRVAIVRRRVSGEAPDFATRLLASF